MSTSVITTDSGQTIVVSASSGPQGSSGVGLPTGGTDGQAPLRDSNATSGITWTTLNKSTVGLGNVDNTSDTSKPVSTAQKTYIDNGDATKEPTVAAGTTAQYYRGDKSWQDLTTAVRANRLNELTAPNAPVNMQNQRLTVLGNPTSDSDAATKSYVDTVAQGLSVKASVEAATTTALPANTYSNGTLTATATGVLVVDDVTVATNDRIIVKNEAAGLKNGIYTVTATGDASNPYVLTRVSDMDVNSEVMGAFAFVIGGTVNANIGYIVTTPAPITLGTTSISFTQFSSAVTPDASSSVKGKLQLAGDLGGTADSPTVPGLASKEPTVTAGTSSQYYRGDKTWQTLDKTAVGLSNVDNTSDATKPISTATQTALTAKADKTSLTVLDTRILAGIFHAGTSSSTDADRLTQVAAIEASYNTKFDYFTTYAALDTADYNTKVKAVLDAGYKSLFILEPWRAGDPANGNLDTIISSLQAGSGGYYRDMVSIFSAIAGDSRHVDSVIISMFHEGNTSAGFYRWQAYFGNNTAAKLKQAYQLTVALARSVGYNGRFAQTYLSTNNSGNATPFGDMYAGDQYIDYVGIDEYNFYGLDINNQAWNVPGQQLRNAYRELVKMSRRPIIIQEFGSVQTTGQYSQAAWLAQYYEMGRSGEFPRLGFVSVFSADGSSTGGPNLLISSTESLRAVADGVNSLRSGGTSDDYAGQQIGKNLIGPGVTNDTTLWNQFYRSGLTPGTIATDTALPPQLDRVHSASSIKYTIPSHTVVNEGDYNVFYLPLEADWYQNIYPHTLSFWAKASLDGVNMSAGIQQRGGSFPSVKDHSIVVNKGWKLYHVTFSTGWDNSLGVILPHFSVGNNASALSVWVAGVKVERGRNPTPSLPLIRSALTVGKVGSGADFECDGNNDQVQINAAIQKAATTKDCREVQIIGYGYDFQYQINGVITLMTANSGGEMINIRGSNTVFQLANGYGGDGFITQNFFSEINTNYNSWSTIGNGKISGITIEGNAGNQVKKTNIYANQAAFPGTGTTGKYYIAMDQNNGRGVGYTWSGSAYTTSGITDSGKHWRAYANHLMKLYAYHYVLEDVYLRDAPEFALYSEQTNTDVDTFNDYSTMEATLRRVHIVGYTYGGINWLGPHDSHWQDVKVHTNHWAGTGQGETALYNIFSAQGANYHGGGLHWVDVHPWGPTKSTGSNVVFYNSSVRGDAYMEGSSNRNIYAYQSVIDLNAVVTNGAVNIELDSCADSNLNIDVYYLYTPLTTLVKLTNSLQNTIIRVNTINTNNIAAGAKVFDVTGLTSSKNVTLFARIPYATPNAISAGVTSSNLDQSSTIDIVVAGATTASTSTIVRYPVGTKTVQHVGSTSIDYGGLKLANLTDPSSAQDAATKNYVDGIGVGTPYKHPVTSTEFMGGTAGNNTATSTNTLAVGPNAGAALTTGSNNVAVGANALQVATTAGGNVAVGKDALKADVSGSFNIAVGPGALSVYTGSSGQANTAIGNNALSGLVTGGENMALGSGAGIALNGGNNNTLVGNNAGNTLTTGSNNIIIGKDAKTPSATSSNMFIVGSSSAPIAEVRIGRDATSTSAQNVTISNSDRTGTDVAAGNLTIQTGVGAGAGAATQIDFKTATPTTAGAGAQSLLSRMTLTDTGPLLNSLPAEQPLSSTTSINGKTTGTTNLYTVPAGKTAVITKAVVRVTAATAITVAPTLGIGVASGEDDIYTSTALTGLTATGKTWMFSSQGIQATGAASNIIKLGIDTGATGTTLTLAVDLWGYLV